MFKAEWLRAVEDECGIAYAPDLHARARDLERLSSSGAFAAAFTGGRHPNAAEVRRAQEAGIPEGYLPFFCEDQPTHTDFYCCRADGNACGPAVLVFADHAVVADWEMFDSFLGWMMSQAGA